MDVPELEEVFHERGGIDYKVVYGYWQPKLKGKDQEWWNVCPLALASSRL